MEKIPQILNGSLSRAIVELGHGELLLICDAGLSIPKSAQVIDLALIRGMPSFIDVLSSVISYCAVEEAAIAKEMEQFNPLVYKQVNEICAKVPIRVASHDDFKELISDARVVVRTGECTPYANIGLIGGVAFDDGS